MDAGAHLCIDRLCQRQSIGEERPLGVDDDEVIDQAKLVLRLGEAEVILGCPDRLTQIPNFIGERVQVGQGVFDIGIGDENLIYVRGNGLPVAGLGGFEIGAEPAALKDRERNARGNRCDGAATTNVAWRLRCRKLKSEPLPRMQRVDLVETAQGGGSRLESIFNQD